MPRDMNPAALLLFWLQHAKKCDASLSVLAAWCKVFELSPNDTPDVFKRLAFLIELAEKVEALILKRADLTHDLFLSGIPSIKAGLSQANLHNPWGSLRESFTDSGLVQLSFCADAIGKFCPEPEIPEDVLKEIGADLNALFDKVCSSSMNSEVKELFLDLLERMRRAIAEYRMRGATSLRDALEISVGRMVLRKARTGERNVAEEEKGLVSQLGAFLRRVDQVLNPSANAIGMAEAFKRWIEN